jgi:hypothetical protein
MNDSEPTLVSWKGEEAKVDETQMFGDIEETVKILGVSTWLWKTLEGEFWKLLPRPISGHRTMNKKEIVTCLFFHLLLY